MRIRCFSPLFFLLLFILLLNSLSKPYESPLCGDYVLRYNREEFSIVTSDGTQVIGSQVESVYFDNRNLFVIRYVDSQENSQSKLCEYWGLDIINGTLTGPMTKSEFDAWYPTLSRGDSPIWIGAGSRTAIVNRWRELNPGQSYK